MKHEELRTEYLKGFRQERVQLRSQRSVHYDYSHAPLLLWPCSFILYGVRLASFHLLDVSLGAFSQTMPLSFVQHTFHPLPRLGIHGLR